MVAALKALGADYVFDVTFSADLTILEEGSELIRRITTGSAPLPQFTSCCPAGQVCGNVPSGIYSKYFFGQKPHWDAGSHYKNLFLP